MNFDEKCNELKTESRVVDFSYNFTLLVSIDNKFTINNLQII